MGNITLHKDNGKIDTMEISANITGKTAEMSLPPKTTLHWLNPANYRLSDLMYYVGFMTWLVFLPLLSKSTQVGLYLSAAEAVQLLVQLIIWPFPIWIACSAANAYLKSTDKTNGSAAERMFGRAQKWAIKNLMVPLSGKRIKTMLDNKGEATIRRFKNFYLLVATPVEKGIDSIDIRKDARPSLRVERYCARIKGKPYAEVELTFV